MQFPSHYDSMGQPSAVIGDEDEYERGGRRRSGETTRSLLGRTDTRMTERLWRRRLPNRIFSQPHHPSNEPSHFQTLMFTRLGRRRAKT